MMKKLNMSATVLFAALVTGCESMPSMNEALDNLDSGVTGIKDAANEYVIDPVSKKYDKISSDYARVNKIKEATGLSVKKIEAYGVAHCGGADNVLSAGKTLLCAPE